MRKLPLIDRKSILGHLVKVEGRRVRYSEHMIGNGPPMFQEACRAGLEGIVSKRAASPYRSGRHGDWVKTKCTARDEFIVGGWRPATTSRRDLGSLLVGQYGPGRRLIYSGRVGTGWSGALGRAIVGQLESIAADASPFIDVPREDQKGARWVSPRIIAEVEFTGWTRDRRIRHPSLKGLRAPE